MLNMREVAKQACETATKMGFRGDSAKAENLERDLLLVHSEISEASECLREDTPLSDVTFDGTKPVGFAVEMADALIRILELCEYWGVPIEEAISVKMEYNKSRPYRHGGKKF